MINTQTGEVYQPINAYGQKHRIPIQHESTKLPSLTQPNLAIQIQQILTRFSGPSAQQQAKGYYENLGEELPKNFDRMSKLEQLHQLALVRTRVEKLEKTLKEQKEKQLQTKAKAKQEAEIEKRANAKADLLRKQQSQTTITGEQKSDK